MKIKITCPKCHSEDIKIISEGSDPIPMYRCGKCKHRQRLFPRFESDKDRKAEDAEEE